MSEKKRIEDKIIGYSAFIKQDRPAFWFENAFFVGDDDGLLGAISSDFSLTGNNKPVPIYGFDLLMDFASSNGKYAFDEKAFVNFQSFANYVGMKYKRTNTIFVNTCKIQIVKIELTEDYLLNFGDQFSSKIIDNFSNPISCISYKAVDIVMAHKNLMAPYLVKILKDIASNPLRIYNNHDYRRHLYSMIILTVIKDKRALYPMLKIASLPFSLIENLFGEMMEYDLPTILQRISGGSYDLIKQFVLNQFASDFCRTEAMKAILCATLDGVLKREESFDFFCSLFTGKEAEHGSEFWYEAASCIIYLYPDENRKKVLKKAVKDGLVESDHMEELNEILSEIQKENLNEYLEEGTSVYDPEKNAERMDDVYDYI